MAKAKIAIGATRWIGGKLMRWSGTAWKASRRKVGGELVKRKSSALARKGSSAITKAKSSAITKADKAGALTKQKSRAITNRRGRIVRSDTANTSRDTVRGSGTRTGQPGKNRKLLKAGKEQIKGRYRAPKVPKVNRTKLDRVKTKAQVAAKKGVKTARRAATNVRQRVASRRLLNTRLRPGMSQAQNTARTTNWLRQNLISSGRNFSKLGILGKGGKLINPAFAAYEVFDQGRKVFNPNDNIILDIANLVQTIRGKRNFGKGRLAQRWNAKLDREAYLADPNKAPGAIPNFDQLTPAQMAEFQAANTPTTPAGSRLPGESTADFHARLRADINRDFPTQPKVKTQKKKTNKKEVVKQEKQKGPTAEQLWIQNTANSPAAQAFSGEERWKLHIANQKWRKKMGRTYTHID